MLALVRRDREFAGIIGHETTKQVNGVTVCIGDVVRVAPGSNHNECVGVVGIFTNKIAVMGLGGDPISTLDVTEIVASHKELSAGSNIDNGYHTVTTFIE